MAADLGSDILSGIDQEEAERRLDRFGPNQVEEQTGPTKWQLAARQFSSPLVLVLVAAAVVSGLLLGDWLEALVILAIVVLNAAIGFGQEVRAANASEGLRRLVSPESTVVRGGIEVRVDTTRIVPGDLMVIGAGDRVFADARLVSAAHLRVDESELTGESASVAKSTQAAPSDAVLGDMTSMLFAGTVVVSGRGTALVTATGGSTHLGAIADLLGEEEPPTPLEDELTIVGRRLGLIAVGVAALVFVVGVLEGRSAESMFLLAVALAVAAIPEGLPAVIGVTLGIGVQRMARRNAIVRRISAVEGLGAVTVICTDKTGTLTHNEIGVQEVVLAGGRVSRESLDPVDPLVASYARLASLCNDARRTADGWHGDPTEIALIRSASELSDPDEIRARWPRVDEIPFESERKRMATFHRFGEGLLVAVKGAPETVIDDCIAIETASGAAGLSPDARRELLDAAEEMAAGGERTLAIAYRELDPATDDLVEDRLVLVALVGMSDQVRDEVQPALDEATAAGVKVVLVTGDHEVTARSVGDDLGLLDGRIVVGGSDLQRMEDDELEDLVVTVGAYARVDPADKVRIVRAWQSQGDKVAMTGDGVNDAPALRIADIGVAMGSGTDVARDASDIILADDNFATIVSAVKGGRTIFTNIRRVISFLLAANVSEVVVVFLGFLLFSRLGDPLLATQILWINLVTDGLPAIALGFDPPDSRVMLRPPGRRGGLLDRGSQTVILTRGILMAVVVLSGYGFGEALGLRWEATRTLVFTTLVLVQLAYVYALEVSESGWREGFSSNAFLHSSVALSVLLQIWVVTTATGNRLFGTVPLTAGPWLISVGLTFAAGALVVFTAPLMRRMRASVDKGITTGGVRRAG